MFTKNEQGIINEALSILESKLVCSEAFTSPQAATSFCRLSIAHLEHEVFGILLLNSQHQMIDFQTPFRGTIDGAAVYPREVVKIVLNANAAAVILTHNHPSGNITPSQADKAITKRISEALRLIDVRTLDHIIVSMSDSYSFAEGGLL
jgi:DNA repair protein RadC